MMNEIFGIKNNCIKKLNVKIKIMWNKEKSCDKFERLKEIFKMADNLPDKISAEKILEQIREIR